MGNECDYRWMLRGDSLDLLRDVVVKVWGFVCGGEGKLFFVSISMLLEQHWVSNLHGENLLFRLLLLLSVLKACLSSIRYFAFYLGSLRYCLHPKVFPWLLSDALVKCFLYSLISQTSRSQKRILGIFLMLERNCECGRFFFQNWCSLLTESEQSQ